MECLSHLNKIITLENVLARLIKCEIYFDLCSGHDGEFWSIVQNTLGESVCLFWCHIFGLKSEGYHYTNFFDAEAEKLAGNEFSASSVKARMLSSLKMSETDYCKLWNEVKECRDKFVAHKESNASAIFPRIHLCRQQAEELRRVLFEFSKKAVENHPYSDWARWRSYYSEENMRDGQFRAACERDFNSRKSGSRKSGSDSNLN